MINTCLTARLASIVTILALVSCGSGTAGSNAAAPSTRPIASNTLRTVANGDFIRYNLSGTIISGGITSNLTGTGTSIFSMNASPVDPSGSVRSTSTLSMTGTLTNGAIFTSNATAYVAQGATGTLTLYGNSQGGWITIPVAGFVTSLPSPVVAPTSWTSSYTLQNGDTTNDTISVLGRATVSTGLGSFEAFHIQNTGTTTLAAGGSSQYTVTSYIVPGIGTIKMTIAQTVTDNLGAITTLTITLSASTTNISY